MTEQEWLEDMADRWMHDGPIAPMLNPRLPVVSDCGWRIMLTPVPPDHSALHERIRKVEYVEFYAVFGGREFTARRPAREMTHSL